MPRGRRRRAQGAGDRMDRRHAAVARSSPPGHRGRARPRRARLATLHFSAPSRAGLLHADPHPGNFRLLADGRLGVLDFGAVARMPGGHPEPIGRLTRLAIAGRRRRGAGRAARRRVSSRPTPRSTPRRFWSSSARSSSRCVADEFQFTRAWLRAEAARLANPREPGVPAGPQPQPAAGLPDDPPGDPGLDRRAVPA